MLRLYVNHKDECVVYLKKKNKLIQFFNYKLTYKCGGISEWMMSKLTKLCIIIDLFFCLWCMNIGVYT